MAEAHREVGVWSIASDGSRSPFAGTGLRVPLPNGMWVGVDLHLPPRGLSVVVDVRNRRPGADPMPTLAIVPRAGNAAMVLIGRAGPTRFEVTPVDGAELTGDIREWLAKTTSGDPLGELVLARTERPTTSARRFVIEYGNLAEVHLDLRESDDAMLVVDIGAFATRVAPVGVPSRFLNMLVQLGGANVATFLFQEVMGTLAE